MSAGAALAALLAALPAGGTAAGFPVACTYRAADDMVAADRCAAPRPGGFAVAPQVAARLRYERGLASLFIDGAWHYRRRSGRMARVASMDNGPDYFEGGLARATVDGHLAYVDRGLRVRIRTPYDQGLPFRHGRAVVCAGCVAHREPRAEVTELVGGRWGVIDLRGRPVVPVTLTQGEFARLPPRVTGFR